MLVKDAQALRLIERMLDDKITEIKPVFDPSSKLGFRYPAIDELLETPSEQTVRILEDLVEIGILKKRFFDKLILCPKCGSFELKFSTQCPKCGSANITKSQTLEHFQCGYVGPEEEFRTDAGYVCPKCKKSLRTIGTDYRRPGILYRCQNCDNLFNEPSEKWQCLKCSEYSPKTEVGEKSVHSYSLDPANRDRFTMELKPKRELEEQLKREGYDVKSSTRIIGQSGVEHEVDLYAVRKAGIFEHKIVLGISNAENEVGPEAIGKLFATAYDVGATDTILIAIPRLSEKARLLANYYRIRVFEAEDLQKAAAQISGKA